MNPIIQMLESRIFIGCPDSRSLGLQQYDILIYFIEESFFPNTFILKLASMYKWPLIQKVFDDSELNWHQHERWYGSPKFIGIHPCHNNQRLTFHGVVLMPQNQGVLMLKSPLNWAKLFPHSYNLEV